MLFPQGEKEVLLYSVRLKAGIFFLKKEIIWGKGSSQATFIRFLDCANLATPEFLKNEGGFFFKGERGCDGVGSTFFGKSRNGKAERAHLGPPPPKLREKTF